VTEERLALSELLDKAGDGDFLRTVAEAALQLLMEADVEGLIGAGRYGERTTWRNGHRDRVLGARQIEPVGRQRRTKTESCPTASGRTRKSWLSPGVMPQLRNRGKTRGGSAQLGWPRQRIRSGRYGMIGWLGMLSRSPR
jgi:hypothetical protein